MSKNFVFDVAEFRTKFEMPIGSIPGFAARDLLLSRMNHLVEEITETINAVEDLDFVRFADGVIDTIYVAVGVGLLCGLPIEKLWNEIHQANMAKRLGVGKIVNGVADRGVIKPEGWRPPEIEKILERAGWQP